MLTVKWVVETTRGTIERIFEARDVEVARRSFDPGCEQSKSSHPHWEVSDRSVGDALFIIDPTEPNFAGRSFDVGTIYVMNETGATVGKYVLNDGVFEPPSALNLNESRSSTG